MKAELMSLAHSEDGGDEQSGEPRRNLLDQKVRKDAIGLLRLELRRGALHRMQRVEGDEPAAGRIPSNHPPPFPIPRNLFIYRANRPYART